MHIPFLEARPPPTDAVSALSRLLEEEQERITRLWSKRLRAETYEVDLPGHDLRAPLSRLIGELARLLRERGQEAVRLWPEVVRAHGARRYDQRFDAEDFEGDSAADGTPAANRAPARTTPRVLQPIPRTTPTPTT